MNKSNFLKYVYKKLINSRQVTIGKPRSSDYREIFLTLNFIINTNGPAVSPRRLVKLTNPMTSQSQLDKGIEDHLKNVRIKMRKTENANYSLKVVVVPNKDTTFTSKADSNCGKVKINETASMGLVPTTST